MDLCGEFITHKVFGRGRIVGLESNCVTVLFLDSNEQKRFVYPSAFGHFLVLEDNRLVEQMQDYKNEIAQSIASAQKENDIKRAVSRQEKSKSVKKTPRKTPQSKAPLIEIE